MMSVITASIFKSHYNVSLIGGNRYYMWSCNGYIILLIVESNLTFDWNFKRLIIYSIVAPW